MDNLLRILGAPISFSLTVPKSNIQAFIEKCSEFFKFKMDAEINFLNFVPRH